MSADDVQARLDATVQEMIGKASARLEEEVERKVRALARRVAREEVASLCGLVLRRLQSPAAEEGQPIEGVVILAELRIIFGEALRDFGGTEIEPGVDEHSDEEWEDLMEGGSS